MGDLELLVLVTTQHGYSHYSSRSSSLYLSTRLRTTILNRSQQLDRLSVIILVVLFRALIKDMLCGAIKRKDRKDIERIVEEANTKDRTGWFKRTQWDEHLQAYSDWQLLLYAIRLLIRKLYRGLVRYLKIRYASCVVIYLETSRLRIAAEFLFMLGSLVYCVRVLVIEFFLLVDERAEQGAAKISSFLKQRARYLVDGSYSPISTILSLLAYAKFIALRTPSTIAGSI
ncbi:hypothetical protein GGP41_005485 [Bipolaris sorokiniana]|uniref:Uncharacterized protein n=1 Tax=Cochliobolus sativus TaxID=45130 RepID=A0A8H5ZIW3_COCSA|nr:hypothetical protein GGP41_005485 [Bipolaris sorokiniana]